MAASAARPAEAKSTRVELFEAGAEFESPRLGDTPIQAISASATGLTLIGRTTLPPLGPVMLSIPGFGRRSARMTFRSDVVATLSFDAPLAEDEVAALLGQPERSSATAASRSNR